MTAVAGLPDHNMIREDVSRALAEDLGTGDCTASLIASDTLLQTRVICRESAVICGQAWFNESFNQLDASVSVIWHCSDGESVTADTEVCRLDGNARAILSAERTGLNFLQTLSATASLTREYVNAVSGTAARILDTRKTLPGLRQAQKYAVLCGGGMNHRHGLYDAILIKENHISAAGSITAAVTAARTHYPRLLLEVEVEDLSQLEEARAAGAQRVLLDNFSIGTLKQMVAGYKGKIELEASGGVTLEAVRAIAESGVDYISTGELTKNIRAVDFSMRFV